MYNGDRSFPTSWFQPRMAAVKNRQASFALFDVAVNDTGNFYCKLSLGRQKRSLTKKVYLKVDGKSVMRLRFVGTSLFGIPLGRLSRIQHIFPSGIRNIRLSIWNPIRESKNDGILELRLLQSISPGPCWVPN